MGHIVRNAILGDEDEKKVESSLKQLYIKQDKPNVECMFWHVEGSLDKECVQVCTALTDHLTDLSREWVAYLRNIHSEVRHVTLKTEEQLNRAAVVHKKYRTQNPDVVDREFREEKYILSTALNDELSRIRDLPLPSCVRSNELVALCKTLKQRFADSCELSRTDELMRCKQTFEYSLRTSEQLICNEFIESITDLLD